MYQSNMWSCLKMDSFDVAISFSTSPKALACLLQEKNIPFDEPAEAQFVVKSKILSLNTVFFISFRFKGEKLIAVAMSPVQPLEGRELHSRYNKIQKALEGELGPPHNRLTSIMSLLDPDNRFARWRHNGILIEHSLLNRFGIEETINIGL